MKKSEFDRGYDRSVEIMNYKFSKLEIDLGSRERRQIKEYNGKRKKVARDSFTFARSEYRIDCEREHSQPRSSSVCV